MVLHSRMAHTPITLPVPGAHSGVASTVVAVLAAGSGDLVHYRFAAFPVAADHFLHLPPSPSSCLPLGATGPEEENILPLETVAQGRPSVSQVTARIVRSTQGHHRRHDHWLGCPSCRSVPKEECPSWWTIPISQPRVSHKGTFHKK